MSSVGPRNRLSPTNLAVYHHNSCELYLWNTYHRPPETQTLLQRQVPPLTQAQFKRGIQWESKLATWLDEQDLLLTVLGPVLTGQDLDTLVTLEDRQHFFLYGLKFQSPSFEQKFRAYGNADQMVNFGIAKPDFVEFTRLDDGRIQWRVIDAKASQDIKTSHHAQIYFYHLCLELLLAGTTCSFVPSEDAAIWLSAEEPSFDNLRRVDNSLLGPPMEDFFFRKLPEILYKSAHKVPWHYNPLCRGCSFEETCRARSVEERKIGAMPNISLGEVSALRSFIELSRPPHNAQLTDIEELDRICRNDELLIALQDQYPTTARIAKRILKLPIKVTSSVRHTGSPRVNAALSMRPYVINKRSRTLPSSEDIAVIISIVLDPSESRIGAFCINTFTNGIPELPPFSPIFGLVGKDDNHDLVLRLAQHLQEIIHLPGPRTWRTQVYVFSSAEAKALYKHLIDVALMIPAAGNPASKEGKLGQLHLAVKICIGAVCEGTELLTTAYQPVVLSGALLDILHKKEVLSRSMLIKCLERLNVSVPSTCSTEYLRITLEREMFKLVNAKSSLEIERNEARQLPKVAVLKNEMDNLISLSVPGLWALPEAVSSLLSKQRKCHSDDELYFLYQAQATLEKQNDALRDALINRNRCIYRLLLNIRRRLDPETTGGPLLLLNEARPLTSVFMDVCHIEPLKKLFFMHQFEVLVKLKTLWEARIEGCPDAPYLEYLGRIKGTAGISYNFRLLSGSIDQSADREMPMYDFLLVGEDGGSNDVPVEVLFDDLSLASVVFPLTKYTRCRWEVQHVLVREFLAVANIDQVVMTKTQGGTELRMSLYKSSNFGLLEGRRYRLSPRLVDFNTSKVLRSLLEADLEMESEDYQAMPPFLRLLTRPFDLLTAGSERKFLHVMEQNIYKQYRELSNLGNSNAGALVLKASQRRAAKRFLTNNLTVIWGPPGSGKTYTIALSLLRLLEVEARTGVEGSRIIALTAMTNAAVEAVLTKLRTLITYYRAIPNLPLEWLEQVNIEHVKQGTNHRLPARSNIHIYAGTVFQLFNFSRRLRDSIDVLIVDEAGQLCLGFLAMVMLSLAKDGKLVIAGDNEQLAPILAGQYPKIKHPLFGSVLDYMMSVYRPTSSPCSNSANLDQSFELESSRGSVAESSQISTVVQLLENFRLNPDLGAFVSTIYSRAFHPQKCQDGVIAAQLQALEKQDARLSLDSDVKMLLISLGKAMSGQKQNNFTAPLHLNQSSRLGGGYNDRSETPNHLPISLALFKLQASSRESTVDPGYETHVQTEAAVAASIVKYLDSIATNKTIFVAAPHRIQRHAVKSALYNSILVNAGDVLAASMDRLALSRSNTRNNAPGSSNSTIVVDTVERLQGSEADFVICLFSYTHLSSLSPKTFSFLLDRRRLNVAISRAKTLCILVSSDSLLRPPASILTDAECARGYAYLRSYEQRSWKTTLEVGLVSFGQDC